MKKMKSAAACIAAMLLAGMMSGCTGTKVTCESLLDAYAKQTAEQQSVSMLITTETDTMLHFDDADEVRIDYVVKTEVDTVGNDAHIVHVTTSEASDEASPKTNAPQEYYYIYDAAASRKTGYLLDSADPVMYQLDMPDYVYPTAVLDLSSSLSGLTLNPAPAAFNGTECYELDGKMTWETFRQTIGQQLIWVVPDLEAGTDLSDIQFDVKVYFTKDDRKLAGIYTDALAPLNTVIARAAGEMHTQTVERAEIIVSDIQYNTGKTITLPADREIIA